MSYWIDPEDMPTAAEAEREAPTEGEIAAAIARVGPAPVCAADFLHGIDLAYTDHPF